MNERIKNAVPIETDAIAHMIATKVREYEITTPEALEPLISERQPFVVRQLTKDWPMTHAANTSADAARDYILQFYEDRPCNIFRGHKEGCAHVFYDDNMQLNFSSQFEDLRLILDEILAAQNKLPQPLIYSGSIETRKYLPGFEKENGFALGARKMRCSVWMGTRARVPAHSDYLENIACVAMGRRHFTLFPPEQFDNLYLGPLHLTPAGRPVSLVDFANPDFDKFPKFQEALQAAQHVMLYPGDVIHIPSMWWHHVESLDPFNILVNFWWHEDGAIYGDPEHAMWHALWAIRDLPQDKRRLWQAMFNHYVFETCESDFAHIPPNSRGILGPLAPRLSAYIRRYLQSAITD